MGQLLPLLGVLAAFFALIGVAWLVAAKLGMLKPRGGGRDDSHVEEDSHPFRACGRLLSPAEASFHSTLRLAMPLLAAAVGQTREPLVFAKVRMLDVIEPDSARLGEAKGARTAAENGVKSKHLDFLLCDPDSTRPLLVIELDDASHQRERAAKGDGFKNAACKAAGVPLYRVRAAAAYNPQTLAREIAGLIRPSGR